MDNHKTEYLEEQIKFYKERYNKLNNEIKSNIFDLDFKPNFESKLKAFINKILKKKKLNIIFIGDNKEVCLKYIFYDAKNYFTIKNKSYTFNETHFYMFKNTPLLFIYENEPIPVTFSNKSPIDSSILNNVMESKFIAELLTQQEGFLGMKINKETLMIIAMILGMIYLISQGFFDDFFTR